MFEGDSDMADKTASRAFGSRCTTIDLRPFLNWPRAKPRESWWLDFANAVRDLPAGPQESWGVPFLMPEGNGHRVIMCMKGSPPVSVDVNGKADYLCLLHAWRQMPEHVHTHDPQEGLVVGRYDLLYDDGKIHSQTIRARFEVGMQESPGTPWLAMPFVMTTTVDPATPREDMHWGLMQTGLYRGGFQPQPMVLHYPLENPHPTKTISRLTLTGLHESPMILSAVTLYRGSSHPLRHLPRRTYRIKTPDGPARVKEADVDQGVLNRIERTDGPRNETWLESDYVGAVHAKEPDEKGEDLLEITAADDATVSVQLEGDRKKHTFSVGEAFHEKKSVSGKTELRVLGRHRQWMQIRIIDTSTGKPTPARVHFSGSRGEYLAPYGHHSHINANWFEDYGADVIVGGRNFAYVQGEFTSDMPIGNVFVEVYKGFEYEPTRMKLKIRPGEKVLEIPLNRWADLRKKGWVTADTHVHFISPHTAWLEGQAEGVNVVNLLASQWGRLFTNVGDVTGRAGVVQDDTIVYVGTENRNHMLGHMSMLGTQGMPVYPMCAGGPTEADIGDPDFVSLAEWAQENKRKGGVVIRPHFPYCGYTEDPVPILKGVVDALEIGGLHGQDFPTQEWYRYLNCGYKVAVAGGTDKMGASTPLGWLRTYAKLDPDKPFDYDAWSEAVRAGRTFSSNGPLIELNVDGHELGDTVEFPASGGDVEILATAESFWPLGKLEVVRNGHVIACEEAPKGAKKLTWRGTVKIPGSGWIAARCSGHEDHPGSYTAAHTSPVYFKCGDTRAFDGHAAEHMLSLVQGSIEYITTLATNFDESSRDRMVKLYKEVRSELKGRMHSEGHGHHHHHGDGQYHHHHG